MLERIIETVNLIKDTFWLVFIFACILGMLVYNWKTRLFTIITILWFIVLIYIGAVYTSNNIMFSIWLGVGLILMFILIVIGWKEINDKNGGKENEKKEDTTKKEN